MRLAIAEAAKGIGHTAPNPPVGAVIVKDDRVIGAGYHRGAGLPHAEIEALASCDRSGSTTAGATAYITLEPCSTTGRTPPCTAALIASGIKRVVYACKDPNPSHSGRADHLLKKAGIAVVSGILQKEAFPALRPFSKIQKTGLPWVIWKCALSLDGKITRPGDEGRWLSSPESRADVQILRSHVDAILTSGQTVRADRPSLNIREASLLNGRSQPYRIILSDHPQSLPQDIPLFTDSSAHLTHVYPRRDLGETLRLLVRDHSIHAILLEAGGKLSGALFAEGLVDEVILYSAPIICGDTTPALSACKLPKSLALKDITYSKIGPDLKIRGFL